MSGQQDATKYWWLDSQGQKRRDTHRQNLKHSPGSKYQTREISHSTSEGQGEAGPNSNPRLTD